MQLLMRDQPQPPCHAPKNNSAERHDSENDRAKYKGGGNWSFWIGRKRSPPIFLGLALHRRRFRVQVVSTKLATGQNE